MDLSGGAGGGAIEGPDLAEIETEQLGLQSAAGEDKLKLLPSPWPADNLPPPTASLLSIASGQSLLAAAGPESLVITDTNNLRQTFINDSADADTKVKNFAPQATIPIPRVSQVNFSSDESCLVIAAEQGGGLAVYNTSALANGSTEPAFQLGTEGESVRQLLPNPNPAEEFSRYFGVVTTNGKLLLADLKERKLVAASSGSTVFHDNVSCACWSRLGKQIVAGLANGTAVQVDPQGVVKATIPQPPQLTKDAASASLPITSILWIETHDFLIVHTPVNQPDADDSRFHLAHRDKQSNSWTFSKLEDPCPPFGLDRKPAHHFLQRLRDWGNLSEMMILASTASTDIGLFTRSKVPLNSDQPIADAFTFTQPPDERRAALPMSADGLDTSPIGMVLDMSVKEKISKPIPTDETIDDSPVPLPALYVLSNEGILSMWWVVYNESVRQNKPYPDLIAAGGARPLGEQKQQQAAPAPTAPQQPATASAFGSNLGGGSTAPAQTSTFGQSSFGAPSTPAFGGTSSIGNRQSPWGAPGSVATGGSSFGKPAFGQTSTFGASSFGQASGMGASKQSPWGTPSQQQPAQQSSTAGGGSVFGGNAAQQSPFMSIGSKSAASGFAALGGGNKAPQPSPFAAASKPSLPAEPSGSTVSFGNTTSFGSGSTTFGVQSQPSMFGSPSPGATFGKPSAPATREESMGDDAATSDSAPNAKPPTEENKSAFGLGNGGFQLGSTFKGDGSAKDDLPKPNNPGAGLFGKGFGEALGDTSKTSSNSEGSSWLSGDSTQAIKKEPGTEAEPKLSDIPPAAPPKVEEKKDASPPTDDAPLPPDPMTFKPKPDAAPAPIPPGFGSDFLAPKAKPDDGAKTSTAPEDAPLPPDFTSTSKSQESKDKAEPVAGSPPVDLGEEKSSDSIGSGSEAEGPEEEEWSDEEGDDEDNEDDEDDEGEDGDEVDETGELDTPEVTDQAGLSAFQSRLTPASPKRAEAQQQDESTTPATDTKDSYTPAGMPQAPIMFQPPQRKGPDSPRSPSPVRSATSPLRNMPSFGSQPPSFPTTQQQQQSSRPPSSSQPYAASQSRTPSQAQPPQRIAVPPAQLAQRQQRPTAPAKPAEPDAGELEDEEDAHIQAILAAPIEPTTEVPSFLAHQDYVASGGEKPGLGGQIERVFRDINSMVDTLALNARSLKGFVEGHRQSREERSRLDLEDEDGWFLGEAGQLAGIVEGIELELEHGRLEDVRPAMEELQDQEKEMHKLRTKTTEARKTLNARRDPDQLAQQHAAPLPMETQSLQTELRQEVQRVQKLLAKAEEQLSVLRAELASQPAEGNNKSNVPTVEAVEKTIRKMTQMIEQKSGDVDVLESQIRKLGGLPRETYEDDLAASLKASRISSSASPAAMRVSRFGSPARTPGTPAGAGKRKSLFDVSGEEVEAYRAKKEGRRVVVERLKSKLGERGVRVVKVGE